jgi:hypothetical protein
VLRLFDISDSEVFGLNPDLKSKVINIQHLKPLKIMLITAFAVIREVPGGGGPDPRAKGEGEARRGTGRHAGSGSGRKVGTFRSERKAVFRAGTRGHQRR